MHKVFDARGGLQRGVCERAGPVAVPVPPTQRGRKNWRRLVRRSESVVGKVPLLQRLALAPHPIVHKLAARELLRAQHVRGHEAVRKPRRALQVVASAQCVLEEPRRVDLARVHSLAVEQRLRVEPAVSCAFRPRRRASGRAERKVREDEGLVDVPRGLLRHARHLGVGERTVAALDGEAEDLLDRVAREALDVERRELAAERRGRVVHQKHYARVFQRATLPDLGVHVHELSVMHQPDRVLARAQRLGREHGQLAAKLLRAIAIFDVEIARHQALLAGGAPHERLTARARWVSHHRHEAASSHQLQKPRVDGPLLPRKHKHGSVAPGQRQRRAAA